MARPRGSTNGITPPGGYPNVAAAGCGFLAGFLDAEATFSITRQRSGAHGCACSVNLRQDDRELLEQLHAEFKMGRLSDVAARGTSKPQTCWKISRKADCAQLAWILRKHPLRGRKSLDFDLWAAAVDEWVGDDPTARPWQRDWTRMAELAVALKAVRRYVPRIGFSTDQRPGWQAHLAGFLTGEAYFGIAPNGNGRTYGVRMDVRTRGDDLPLLQATRADLRAGKVYHYQPASGNPVAQWAVLSAADRDRVITLLDRWPVRGRKRREYELWRKACLSGHQEREALALSLKQSRKFPNQLS